MISRTTRSSGLIDAFDPDAFVVYDPTWDELAEFAPAEYKRAIGEVHRKTAKKYDEEFADQAVASLGTEAIFRVRPPDDEIDELVRRTAPFHHERAETPLLDSYDGISEAAWPLTDVRHFADLPEHLRNPTSPKGASRRLLLTASTGRIGAGFGAQLADRNVEVIPEKLSKWRWAQLAVDRQRDGQPDYPWALSNLGLGRYRRGWHDVPAAVVVGNTPWDFALFYALKQISALAWWLPTWLAADGLYLQSLTAALAYEPRSVGREVAVISASSTAIRDRIADDLARSTHGIAPKVADWTEVLPDEPMRFYELHNTGRYRPIQVIDGSTLPLDTPLPRQVSTQVPTEMRWITEIHARDWAAARDTRLPRALLSELGHGAETMRVSRSGVAYFCPNIAVWGGESLEGAVVHPVLHVLDVVEQVESVLREAGWSCELSDKGIYAEESTKLFGGSDGLADALRDSAKRPLLDAFLAKTGPGQRLPEDGRRYLTWKNFKDVVAPADPVAPLTELVDRGVLSRGILLRCRRCRQRAWHHIGAVGDEFTCRRCRSTQPTTRETWHRDANEPPWSYQLAEVVYQFLLNNGDLPLLATKDVFADTTNPFLHGHELDVTDPDGECRDVDIFALDGYKLWIPTSRRRPPLPRRTSNAPRP